MVPCYAAFLILLVHIALPGGRGERKGGTDILLGSFGLYEPEALLVKLGSCGAVDNQKVDGRLSRLQSEPQFF